MGINCASCGLQINLDHKVFFEYEGPVKCFFCGAMMELKTEQGVPHSIDLFDRTETEADLGT